jgi:DMSO/TMAO reductase YedYZ heme-binding membrane subunit
MLPSCSYFTVMVSERWNCFPREGIVSAKGGRSPGPSRGFWPRRGPTYQDARVARSRSWMPVAFLLFIVAAIVVVAVGSTRAGHVIGTAAGHFLLYYAGVFTLISLTAAVGIGLVATDRIIMSPDTRVTAQAVHRAVSFGAVSFLVIHITTEILARRSHAVDAVLPFLDHKRTFYLGLGTLASDLLVLIAVTGILRRRFAETSPPWVWRLMHAMAYVAWPMGIWHGLLSGRQGKPYVDWSYGALVAAVGVALLVRFVAKDRSGQTAGQPVPERMASAWPPAAGAAALGQAGFGTAHLAISSGAVPVGRPQQLALPAGSGTQVTANLPADRGQVVDRVQFGRDETAADFAYDDPGGHFHQDDPGGQYHQDDPREYIRQVDPREYYHQADPGGQYRQDDPREHFHQADPREYYRQDDPRGQFHQDDPREYYHRADPGGPYRQDDLHEYVRQDDPRGYIRQDDPRERFRQDEAPAFENDSADYEETGPLPVVPYSRYGTRS